MAIRISRRPRLQSLQRLGSNPLAVVSELAYRVLRRFRMWRVRRRYDAIVAPPTSAVSFRPLGRELPPISELPPGLSEAAERVRLEADRAAAHEFDVLGSGTVRLGSVIDWHKDFKSDIAWPADFFLDVNAVNLDDESDPKVPWELSRGHHLLALARAAAIHDSDDYVEELARQFKSWMATNPPGRGINWVNPMEVAIRAVNWVWALSALDARARARLPMGELVASLGAHGRHLAANLEGTPGLRSNHFLADVLGLLVLGHVLDSDPEAPGWKRFSRRALEREIRSQVLPDGVGFEGSMGYHGLSLEMFLVAWWVGAERGEPFSAGYESALRRMLRVSAAVRHPDGRVPAFGDSDDGRILPASSERSHGHDHLLWAGAALLASPRPSGAGADEVAWNFGLDAWTRSSEAPGLPVSESTAFKAGGIFVLAGGGTHLVVRCGDVGQRGNGGHGHNDLLSYELARRDTVVVDPGTYVYTADPPARNRFRSTAVHNTVMVQQAELNPIPVRRLFRLPQVATPALLDWRRARDHTSLEVGHDAYHRLPARVGVRRRFELDHSSGDVFVIDELTGLGEVEAACRVQLAPEVDVQLDGKHVELANASLRIEFDGVDSLHTEVGWVSPSYGVRQSAIALVAHTRGRLPLRWTHRICEVSR